MTEIEFKIFKAIKRSRLTVNEVVYSLFISSFALAFFARKYLFNHVIEIIGLAGFIASLILIIYFRITHPFRRQSLDGTLNEILTFKESEILIASNNYQINEIKKIEFSIGDYYDRYEYSSRGNLNPGKTNGTSNTCTITLINGEKIIVNFQLLYKNEFLRMRELLIKYYEEQKIHFLKLIEYLKIDRYEDIQEFKKTLSSKPNK